MARTQRTLVAVTAAAVAILASGASPALAHDDREPANAVDSSPLTAEFIAAGPGEWDLVAESGFVQTSGYSITKQALSAGGDFLFCVTEGGHHRLREADTNGDDFVDTSFRSYLQPGGCELYENIGSYVDGSNNRAEFYVERIETGGGTVSFYD
ncbi:hypothetical protein ACTWP5_11335 [Streptomyces sp. 4N509B]|uniref:hypothetical protein n=1 Tax=Streptomyces sp. 4N509B TaxID=3457413 RepID=UPI003FCF82EB